MDDLFLLHELSVLVFHLLVLFSLPDLLLAFDRLVSESNVSLELIRALRLLSEGGVVF